MIYNNRLEVSISHRIGDFQLNIKFDSGSGVTALFGRSGSGKSTVINLLAGLTKPDSGYIKLDGRCLFDHKKFINITPQHRQVGYVFQDSRLFPHMNVKNNLQYGKRFIHEVNVNYNFKKIVELLDLSEVLERYPLNLSGGEKQRVAIGRALLTFPKLVLMDEPLASLDSDRKSEIIKYIKRLKDDLNISIVYVSHNLNEVTSIADMLVVLENGSSIASGTIEDIMCRLNVPLVNEGQYTGSILDTELVAHDIKFSLSKLFIKGVTIWVPKVDLSIGAKLRVQILASDISLSLNFPEKSSVLNIFKAHIMKFSKGSGPYTEILLDIGVVLVARITHKSMSQLKLIIGQDVFLMVKAVSILQLKTSSKGTGEY